MSGSARQSGFTLVELTVVVLIVAILAALAVSNMSRMVDSVRLRTAANAVKRQLVIARTRAISDPNIHVGVCFDTGSSSRAFVFLDVRTGTQNHYDASDPHYMGDYPLPYGIRIIIPSVGGGGISDSVVVFRGDGSARNGGSVILQSSFGEIRAVNVLASTGRVRIR